MRKYPYRLIIKDIGRFSIYFVLSFLCACAPRITSFDYEDKEPDYRMRSIGRLGKALKESSGLEYFDNSCWSINDSGNSNLLYSFAPSKKTKISITEVSPSVNVDWESLSEDEDYLYIADVGDNFGRREIIKIYLVSKESLSEGMGAVSDSILIRFNEKKPDAKSLKYSPFDCEAITVIDDSIYLFTKNWADLSSSIYIIPSEPGYYSVNSRLILETDLLVTGADYSRNSGNLWLIGYKNFRPVFILFPAFNAYGAQEKPFLRFDFRRYFGLQVEGITVSPEERIYFSCEKTFFPARLYELKAKD